MPRTEDTICAIATAAGGAARGMVRVSGAEALAIVGQLVQSGTAPPLTSLRQPTAVSRHLAVALHSSPRLLPCELFVWPTARSYTREPVVEVHTLGSRPILEALVAALCRAGARLAQPGEFTLRAFLAGRLDLTQAEAVLGVIDARGETELQHALSQLAGGLARPLQQLRDDLLQLLAELEAGLDFVEEDIEFISAEEIAARLASAVVLLHHISEQMSARRVAAPVAQIVLVGPPNVGKSSLFNALVSSCRASGVGSRACESYFSPAIVSPRAGTTRDYLVASIDLDGLPCDLIDTAGIDDAPPLDPTAIDSDAQSNATEQRQRATIRVRCVDITASNRSDGQDLTAGDILVLTKADLVPQQNHNFLESANAPLAAADCRHRAVSAGWSPDATIPVILTSSRTGQGVEELAAALQKLLLNEPVAQHGQAVAATAERCRESVRLAAAGLELAAEITANDAGDELLAAELRRVLAELGKVVGAIYTDDILDRIFSSFCIGK